MKLNKKIVMSVGAAAVLVTLAIATFTGSVRLRDGGSDGASHISYARDSGVYRIAFLKRDNSTGTFQAYVAGDGITGDQLCSSGLYCVSKPAISRDGNIVTFWGYVNNSNNKTVRAYYYQVGVGGPTTTNATYSSEVGDPSFTETWPPQATNVNPHNSTFKIIFVNRLEAATPIEAGCTRNSGSDYWKNGQLYMWDGNPSSSVTIVSTADFSMDGCAYLATQSAGDFGNDNGASRVYYYTISSSTEETPGYKVSWSATAKNQMSGVTQNHQQIIMRDITGGTRELISKNSSGTEGNNDSIMQSATGDTSMFAFSSLASNLTSYSDTNSKYDIFRRDRSGNATVAAYSIALNNSSSLYDGNCYWPVISGDGALVAFHTYSVDLVTFSTDRTPAYAIGGTLFCFMSRFTSNPGTSELASYYYNDSTNWRSASFPSLDYDGAHYGMHSTEGDLAYTTQSAGQNDIYELTGFY